MKITDVFGLHYQCFIIQIEGTKEEAEELGKRLEGKWTDKEFLITLKGGNIEYETGSD